MTNRKLRLSRETLRQLDNHELDQAVGGAAKETTACTKTCFPTRGCVYC